MIGVLEIVLAVFGLIGLFSGRLPLSKTKVVLGVPARLLGALALAPMPMAFVVILGYVASQAPANPERFAEDNKLTIAIIEAVIVLVTAALVFGIASAVAVNPQDAERRRRRREESDDEYEDDREDRDSRPRRPWDR